MLTFRKLETLAGLCPSVHFSLYHPGIPGQKSADPKGLSIVGIVKGQGPGNPQLDGFSLSGETAAFNVNFHVPLLTNVAFRLPVPGFKITRAMASFRLPVARRGVCVLIVMLLV